MTNAPKAVEPPARVLAKLFKRCARRTIEYWTYEICVGQHVSQSHGNDDTYMLGRWPGDARGYHGPLDIVQHYENGQACEGLSGQPPRQTTVQFVCGRAEMKITHVVESETCHYLMTVATPEVCNDERWPQNAPDESAGGNDENGENQISSDALEVEGWYLEVAETAGGEGTSDVTCVAHSIEDMRKGASAGGSALNFHTFELALADVAGPLQGAVARHFGRHRLERDQFVTASGGQKHTIQSSPVFDGDLEYVNVHATTHAGMA